MASGAYHDAVFWCGLASAGFFMLCWCVVTADPHTLQLYDNGWITVLKHRAARSNVNRDVNLS